MVFKQMPHHQFEMPRFGQVDKFLSFRTHQGERFFHVDVLSRLQNRLGHAIMQGCIYCDHHGIHTRIRKDHLHVMRHEGLWI